MRLLGQLAAVGVTRAIVVVGHDAKRVMRGLAHHPRVELELELVEEPRWEEGLATSLLAAAGRVQGPFFLAMADHYFDDELNAVPVVAFTHGKAGCEVFVCGKSTRVGTYPTSQRDPTGAGDVFASAFFLALGRGTTPVEAARLGAGAASVIVEARGGEAFPRMAEATARSAQVCVLEG